MAANPKWQRYVYATISKSLLAALAATPLVIEFLNPKRTPTWEDAATKAEVTISGPRTSRVSPNRYRVFVDIFVVVTSDAGNSNAGHLDAVGTIVQALDKCFLVKDYGDTGLVDVGQLQLRSEDDEGIDVTHLKPTQEDTQIHSTILARYDGRF